MKPGGNERGAVWPALLLWASAPILSWFPVVLGGAGWLTPLLSGTAAWLYLRREHRGPRPRVILVLLTWVALLSASLIFLTLRLPESAAALIPHGVQYWEEMRPYVATGVGKESTPSMFIPEHLTHLLAFGLGSVISAGLGGLILGAFLTGYMSFYVGRLAASSTSPLLAALLGWHPWSLLRVIAFVILGVSLARVMLARPGLRPWWRQERFWLLAAGLLWCADLGLKAALAGTWSAVLRDVAGVVVAPR